MPIVDITIGKRVFQLMCEDGHEPHLQGLAREVSGRITALAETMGSANDVLLLVMATLMMQDELNESDRQKSSDSKAVFSQEDVDLAVAEAIKSVSSYVEEVAERLEGIPETV